MRLLAASGLIVVLLAGGCSKKTTAHRSTAKVTTTTTPTTATPPATPPIGTPTTTQPPGATTSSPPQTTGVSTATSRFARNDVAVARDDVSSVKVFDAAGGQPLVSTDDGKPISVANPNENGVQTVFLIRTLNVEAQGERWHEVYLPVRPNGTFGWIRAADVTLTYNEFAIQVSLGAHRLTLFERGVPVADYPVGLGVSATPTPGGVFYIKELLAPPEPDGPYGTYAYGLSGFSPSDELRDFAGGSGVIGIHGTNDDSSIGTDVSHGCIRMHNADIGLLAAKLPLGVPVEILA